MCGICGLVAGERERTPDREAVARMSGRLVHRGPDDDGLFCEGPVALAARRLSIIDLAGGHQPIAGEDGSAVVVQNGEIYNYRELKRELEGRGHRFATDCDTEVLVHGYEEWGEGFVERLRGMFAIALWDKRRQRLLLARDRFGIKPLYYRDADGGLSFASELKAMLEQPGFSREIDPQAVSAYLAFNSIPAPLTIFKEARKLPPGFLLTWEGGEVTLRRFARPGPSTDGVRGGSAEELAAELREVLDDSVRAHLVADVPVGVLLSGGVDSGGLAALASRHVDEPLRTFSIGFEEEGFNELSRARLVAERYGTDHHELVLRPDAVELFPKLVEAFDEPFGDSSALPTYLVSELAVSEVKVALSGEGGDELFGGYYTYVADLLARRVGRLAALARPLAEALPSRTDRVGFDYKAKRFARAAANADPLVRHHGWKEIFSAQARAELAGPGTSAWDPLDVYRERYAETASADPLARMQDVDLGIYLVDDLLVKTDRLSMAHSLELRVPFLDPKVAEFAFSLPRRLKVRGFAKKRLLRQALAPLLPREIVRGRKQGFSIPIAAWLRGPLEPFAREVLAPSAIARQGLLDPTAVTPILDRHCSGQEDLSRQIWGLMALTLWFDRYAH
jgi:asparagine synthase (glutamine-hydrolysing)